MNFSKLQKIYYWHTLQFCSWQPNGRFWAANLLIEWNFSKFSSFLLPATCLEWIGSVSFTQKNEFYRVKIEQIFATESWFDGKNSQNSNIVNLQRNSKIHFLALSSHFEKENHETHNVRIWRIFSVKSTFYGKILLNFYTVKIILLNKK